ncbi:MAG: ABC transporter permease, partial [Promicromonosporaceae bacterium]|nr:ABC transporter permease [Promicromonosporaceae bacterium]
DVTTVADRAAGEALIEEGKLDALVLPADSGGLTIIVDEHLDPTLQMLFNGIAGQQALAAQIINLGGDPGTVTSAVAEAHAEVTALNPPPERDVTQIVAGVLVGILMFMAIMICGQMVAVGVVEEKTSRVVELLLSTVKPTQLLAGKTLGIGVVGLVQVALTVAAAAAAASVTGMLDDTGLRLGSTVVWALIWFMVGFATFALILAALAALVSRQEEVGSVIMPVTMFMILPYILGVNVLPVDPTNALATNLSYVPGIAPFLMPLRDALDVVELWEQLLALGISLAAIPVLIWIGARIYSNAVLRTGARIKLKEAFTAG